MADATAISQGASVAATTYSASQPADVTMASPPATTAAPPAVPEFVSETLYIQNLNERIKVDGAWQLHWVEG